MKYYYALFIYFVILLKSVLYQIKCKEIKFLVLNYNVLNYHLKIFLNYILNLQILHEMYTYLQQ